jgi:uncharacterized protein
MGNSHRFGEFSKTGLAAQACGNSMRTQNVTLKDLLPGFAIADRGGLSVSPSCRRWDTRI